MIRRLSLFTLATAILLLSTLAVFTLSTPALSAPQRINVAPDGHITFFVSLSGVTRISVEGSRIRNMVKDHSAFEMSNDENTGDVFIRLANSQEAEPETGYLITENGHTIGYTMIPQKKVVGAVLIKLQGIETEATQVASSVPAAGGFSDDIALTMTEIVRAVARDHVFGKVAKSKSNKVLKTVVHGEWKATVLVVTGGKTGRLVTEQEFAKGQRAVWVQNKSLGPNESTFVIVVGAK